MSYIWQHPNWPQFSWESKKLLPLISSARLAQGKLLSKVSHLGFKLNQEAQADILTEEALKTSAIEGELLNRDSVRSSVAQHLGLPSVGMPHSNRSIDGLVEVLLDATQQFDKPLTAIRLKRWQAALFPTGQVGLRPIRTGKWRKPNEPMQVLSGPIGKEKIHFEAPPGHHVDKEMKQFFNWWKNCFKEEGIIRSGIAHFYFVTIHPFEDGNGRIARALTDMVLAQDENLTCRYYSLSSQIMEERNQYYKILEKSQKGDLNITEWLMWYLGCYERALKKAEQIIGVVLEKTLFWQTHHQTDLNTRQRKVVQKLLDAGKEGFQGGLTTRKYLSIAKVSRATAFREISELVEKGFLKKNRSKGRSTSYNLKW